jgi:hypothetical protein
MGTYCAWRKQRIPTMIKSCSFNLARAVLIVDAVIKHVVTVNVIFTLLYARRLPYT